MIFCVILSFQNKGLKDLFENGRSARIDPNLQQRCLRRLDALDNAPTLLELNLPGFDLHPLKGQPLRYSLHVSGPWCITFEWSAPNASRVDLEQYH
jgi:proteic killer suppression protein